MALRQVLSRRVSLSTPVVRAGCWGMLLRRWDAFFQNLAVYGYFAGAQRLAAPDDTNIFIEAYPHGWLWNILLHTGWMSVGAVVDSHTGQEGLRRSDPQRFLAEQLAQAPYTAHMLQKARLAAGPFVVKDWSYTSDHLVGDGYILVGDAACFVDPLFSSGVHLALMAGVLAAAYVTSALKDPGMRTAAGQMYTALYRKEYEHFRAMAQLSMPVTALLTLTSGRRRLLGGSDTLSPRHALFVPSLDSHRVGTNVVLEHGAAPAQFVASVQTVEAERQARRARLAAVRTQTDPTPTTLYQAIPHLATGIAVQRQPIPCWRVCLGPCPDHGGIPRRDAMQRSGGRAGASYRWPHLGGRAAGHIVCGQRGRAACTDRHQRPYSPADPHVDGTVADLVGL